MKTEWKEYYRVMLIDKYGAILHVIFKDLISYNDAVNKGKQSKGSFKIDKYFKQVEVEPIYEYLVLYKSMGMFCITDKYYLSKEGFSSRALHNGWEFIELIQATKRERK